MMRVAIALINANILGGTTKFTSDLCEMLGRFDHELALCSWKKPNEHSFEGLQKIEKIYTPSWVIDQITRANQGKGFMWNKLLASGSSIRRCIKDFNPDLIISADLEPGVFSSVPNNVFKIHYCHFPTEAVVRKNTYPFLLFRVPYWHQHYKQLPRLDYTVCNSHYTEQVARVLWGPYLKRDSLKKIYPTIDVSKFQVKKDKINQLCYVGRLDSHKGIEHVIESYIDLYDECKCGLKIVGAISQNVGNISYAKQIIKKVDELKGQSYPIEIKMNVLYDEIIDTLVSSKILLTYNPMEHFGIVPVEAQAAGCVPIVADGGGQQETVLHNVTGFRVSSPNEFSKYVKQLVADNSLFQRMSEKGKHWASNFSFEEIELQWNNLLLEIDEKKRTRI